MHKDVEGTEVQHASTATRVLVVSRDRNTALLIGELLRSAWRGSLVVAHVERVVDAARELVDHASSCVLLDLPPDRYEQVAAIEQLRTATPEAALVVLAESHDDDQAVEAIGAGAQDYLVKNELFAALLCRAVRYAIERKQAEVALAHQALHDQLTDLPNRALFLDRLGVAVDRSRRSHAPIAVLFLDVDNFKQVNDTFGHEAGDKVLAGLADRLKGMLRPMDTVARFGGDEFTFLFEDLASEREVVLIAERISQAAAQPIRIDGRETSVTVSIGIATADDLATGAETVIREADAAMYRAKELGRSRYELFDHASRQRAMDRLELEGELRHAVERSELRVHYQPSVSLAGHTGVSGIEALVRWEHPQRGLLAPREFIPLAEETGLMVPIGQFVLEQALHEIAQARHYRPALVVSVNLSYRQLQDVSLVPMLANAIRSSGVDPAALVLEVTEAAISRAGDAALRTLQGLKGLGVRLAIDDFGAGSSSLTSLKQLPVDTLKMHESIVGELGRREDQRPIVGAMVELGHALGLRVIAEGVETDQQLIELRELGCDGAQGFLFGRPVPAHEVPELLQAATNGH